VAKADSETDPECAQVFQTAQLCCERDTDWWTPLRSRMGPLKEVDGVGDTERRERGKREQVVKHSAIEGAERRGSQGRKQK